MSRSRPKTRRVSAGADRGVGAAPECGLHDVLAVRHLRIACIGALVPHSLRSRSGRDPSKQPGDPGATLPLGDDLDKIIDCEPGPVCALLRRPVRWTVLGTQGGCGLPSNGSSHRADGGRAHRCRVPASVAAAVERSGYRLFTMDGWTGWCDSLMDVAVWPPWPGWPGGGV